MSSRLLALWLATWGLAVACGTDDPAPSPPLEDVGGAPSEAGAPSSDGGADVGVGAGAGAGGASSGAAGTGGSAGSSGGAAGSSTAPGGSAGEPAAGGAPAGGAPTEPSGPGSPTCGAGKFQTEGDCAACPALPNPHPPTLFHCASVLADKLEEDLILELSGLTLHEPLRGQVSIGWSDVNQVSPDGQAEVPFEYSPVSGQFFFDLPWEARYADHWKLEAWSFADACGFVFTAPALTIEYGGAVYSCNDPD